MKKPEHEVVSGLVLRSSRVPIRQYATTRGCNMVIKKLVLSGAAFIATIVLLSACNPIPLTPPPTPAPTPYDEPSSKFMEADLQDFANLFASLDNYENEPVTYMHAIMEVVWCVEDAKGLIYEMVEHPDQFVAGLWMLVLFSMANATDLETTPEAILAGDAPSMQTMLEAAYAQCVETLPTP